MAVNQANLEQSIKDAFDSAFTALTHAEPTVTLSDDNSEVTTTYAEVNNTVGPDVADMRDAIAKAVSVEVLNHIQLLTTAPTGATAAQANSATTNYLETFEAEDQILALKTQAVSIASAASDISAQVATIVPALITGIGAAGVTGAAAATAATAACTAPLTALAADIASLTSATVALELIVEGMADGVQ